MSCTFLSGVLYLYCLLSYTCIVWCPVPVLSVLLYLYCLLSRTCIVWCPAVSLSDPIRVEGQPRLTTAGALLEAAIVEPTVEATIVETTAIVKPTVVETTIAETTIVETTIVETLVAAISTTTPKAKKLSVGFALRLRKHFKFTIIFYIQDILH